MNPLKSPWQTAIAGVILAVIISLLMGTSGSGLGLTVVKQWVQADHGSIWAENKSKGTGLIIHFTIPQDLSQERIFIF